MNFKITDQEAFEQRALEVFRFQAKACKPYAQYIELLGVQPSEVQRIEDIPFLPISLFRTHNIYTAQTPPDITFTSSGTTSDQTSRHAVASVKVYQQAFDHCFRTFYGAPSDWAIFALLPSYAEREGSSLIYMVEHLREANPTFGGFYLYDHKALCRDIAHATAHGQRILLLGVTFALLDLAESAPLSLPAGSVVMETGGMKGRRAEISRTELHHRLTTAFGVPAIHSEYGMTELLSQAYSDGHGLFRTSSLMRVMPRDLLNPLRTGERGRQAGLNVIDLANIYSCSFIATGDRGVVFADGSFTVDGRITGEILRGCNMLTDSEI